MYHAPLDLVKPESYGWAVARAHELGLLSADHTSALFVDLDILDQRLHHLEQVFPDTALHAIPVKTHPILSTLRYVVSQGYGLECASLEEVALALRAKCPSDKIVWDSPAKTQSEIDYVIQHAPGAIVNANSIDELNMYPQDHGLRLGLRILLMSATGAPKVFDVSASDSKFGEPITRRQQIIDCFLARPDLVGLHLHAGSDIGNIEKNATRVAAVYDLAIEINQARHLADLPPLDYIDIGGGAGVYLDGRESQGLASYSDRIRSECQLYSSSLQVITEFGRFTYGHCGWLWSRIASLRANTDDHRLAILHVGADALVREIYQPHAQRHSFIALDPHFKSATGSKQSYDLAGPLCFAGDVIEREVMLPALSHEHSVIICNAASNSLALWSRHCSRRMPAVIHYRRGMSCNLAKPAETLDDIIQSWS